MKSFLGEINEIFLNSSFSTFDQETLDGLIGTLRERGNSNATINRKLAALSKLLRKACKMGDLHSLPEFRRQKERSGRIRFLDYRRGGSPLCCNPGPFGALLSPFRVSRRHRRQARGSDRPSMD